MKLPFPLVLLAALALFVFPSLTCAADTTASTPEALVTTLYKVQGAEKGPLFQTKDRALVDHYFVKKLADLIWKDAVSAQGEVGALDFDPLYDAQDVQIAHLTIHKAEITKDTATVLVTFENEGHKEKVSYDLAITAPGVWKISELHFADGRTLSGVFK